MFVIIHVYDLYHIHPAFGVKDISCIIRAEVLEFVAAKFYLNLNFV